MYKRQDSRSANAAALAAAFALRESLRGKCVALVLTGANATMDMLRLALATDPLFPLEGAPESRRGGASS